MSSVVVSRLAIYPVKSLDPLVVEEATLLPSGCLEGDRRFALVDDAGNLVNGKRERKVHAIRVRFEGNATRGLLWFGESQDPTHDATPFDLLAAPGDFAERVSAHLGYRIRVEENREAGFPDDTDASGPTVISRETLLALGDIAGASLEELRRRFRANVEISGGGPFFEDRAFGPPGVVVPLCIGEAKLYGNNPCRRCAVPGRDSWTGETHPGFAKTLSTWREATIGDNVDRERFADNWYRLALNTRPMSEATAQRIALGDRFEIAGDPISLEAALARPA